MHDLSCIVDLYLFNTIVSCVMACLGNGLRSSMEIKAYMKNTCKNHKQCETYETNFQ